MEEKAFYKQLVDRYVAKSLSDEELEVFVALVNQGKLDEEISLAMDKAEQYFDREELLVKPKVRHLWPRVAMAAAVFTAIVFSFFFYNQRRTAADVIIYARNDISPGQNGATLTLANGKVVRLSDAQKGIKIGSGSLTYDDGSSVIPDAGQDVAAEANRSELMASTARGQTYMVLLQDGTKVWLNAASTLTFPSTFTTASKRVVTLDGEAYFEVFKDKAHPFIVKSEKHDKFPGQEITVLGTHFNVNAYKDESSIKTTLLEGSVKIASEAAQPRNDENEAKQSPRQAILKPNQQALLSGFSPIEVENVDAQLSIDWKNGSFVFQGQKLSELMKRVERWYDVQVVYKNEEIKNQKFTGEISKYNKLAELLTILQRTGRVSFEIDGRKIIVSN